MRPRYFLTLAAFAALTAACQRTDRPVSQPSMSSAIVRTPEAPLRDTRWVLHRIAGQPVADTSTSHQPFLRITDAGTVEGYGSCNTFQATLQPVQNDGEIQFSPLRTTRMTCPAYTTEAIYLKALQAARAYRIAGDTLWLYGNAARSGTPLARLEVGQR